MPVDAEIPNQMWLAALIHEIAQTRQRAAEKYFDSDEKEVQSKTFL